MELGKRERLIYVWGWEACHFSMHTPHTKTLPLILPSFRSARTLAESLNLCSVCLSGNLCNSNWSPAAGVARITNEDTSSLPVLPVLSGYFKGH